MLQLDDPLSAVRLAGDPLRGPLEQLVSAQLGRRWSVRAARDLADFSSHPAALLSDGDYVVFAKFSDAANGAEQFVLELDGLRLLAERAGVLTPRPIGIAPAPGGNILALEAVQALERGPRQWREIGQALARIHMVKGARFGLERHSYFGPLYQDNAPADTWASFYAERRLRPGLRLALDAGRMPAELARQIDLLIARLPELCGPPVAPSLLHGDAQQNNFISSAAGAVVIDPALYYGHPELDLALVDYFQPVPDELFAGYRELLPIDPGFAERRELWRIWGYLAVVAVDGDRTFLARLAEAVQHYL